MSTAYDCVHYGRGPMRSCIYGLAAGDALGVPYGFCRRDTFECTGMADGGTHGRPAGTRSDGTSMAPCICPSIERLAHIDAADIADRFRRRPGHGDFTCDGRAFDAGATCKGAVSTGVSGKSYDDCGDGSPMRTAPPASPDYLDTDKIRGVSAIAHAHPAAERPCVAPCDISRTVRHSGTPARHVPWRRHGNIVSRPVEAVKGDGYREHTPEAALRCFSNTNSYADCTLAAVNSGGDADTAAAAAGALAGVYHGFEAIPPKWTGRLRGKAVIDRCIQKGDGR